MIVKGIEKSYEVVWDVKQGRFTCTCPHFEYRLASKPGAECKHITQARLDGLQEGKKRVLHSYIQAQAMFTKWYEILRPFTRNNMLRFCGSFRRHKQWVKDHDIVIYLDHEQTIEGLKKAITDNGGVISISGKHKIVFDDLDFPHDVRIVWFQEEFFSHVLHCTGSKEENIRLRKIAWDQGYKLSEHGLTVRDSDAEDKDVWYPESEQALYEKLGEEYVIPELR